MVISIATAFGVFWAFTRGEQVVLDGNSSLVRPVVQQAGGHVVLAEEPLVEALAAHGVTIWVGNPLDAFAKADQTAYLDFVAGRRGGRAALDHVDVVVVQAGGSPARLVAADGRFIRSRDASGWLVYQREP